MSVESSQGKSRDLAAEAITFDVSALNHAIVQKYQPAYLSRGAEHIAYEMPKHPDLVAKANGTSIKAAIDSNFLHKRTPDAFPEELVPSIDGHIQSDLVRFHNVRSFFGSDHVPNCKQMFVKVPMTPAILADLYEGNSPVSTNECWALVTLQKKVSEMIHGTQVSPLASFRSEESFQEMCRFIEADKGLKEALVGFLAKVQKYNTLPTGEILDIYGDNNVAFFKKDGSWSYSLVDVLYEEPKPNFDTGRGLVLRFQAGEQLIGDERENALGLLGYVLNLWKMTDALGTENKMHLVSGDFDEHVALFDRLSKKENL